MPNRLTFSELDYHELFLYVQIFQIYTKLFIFEKSNAIK